MKGRFTDMIPVRPGNFTLSLAARTASTRSAIKRTEGSEGALSTASPSSRKPEIMTNATKIRADNDFGILVLPVLAGAQADDGISAPGDRLAPDNAVGTASGVTPNNGVTPNDGIVEQRAPTPYNGIAPDNRGAPGSAGAGGDRLAVGHGVFASCGIAVGDGRRGPAVHHVCVPERRINIQITGANGEHIILR